MVDSKAAVVKAIIGCFEACVAFNPINTWAKGFTHHEVSAICCETADLGAVHEIILERHSSDGEPIRLACVAVDSEVLEEFERQWCSTDTLTPSCQNANDNEA